MYEKVHERTALGCGTRLFSLQIVCRHMNKGLRSCIRYVILSFLPNSKTTIFINLKETEKIVRGTIIQTIRKKYFIALLSQFSIVIYS